jgi:hypothetical protein
VRFLTRASQWLARRRCLRSFLYLRAAQSSNCDPVGASANRAPKSYAVPITSRGFTSGYSDTRDEKGPRDLIIDKNAWLSASGSPIFLENGAVIGILVRRGIDNGSGLAMGGPASFLAKVLSQRGNE